MSEQNSDNIEHDSEQALNQSQVVPLTDEEKPDSEQALNQSQVVPLTDEEQPDSEQAQVVPLTDEEKPDVDTGFNQSQVVPLTDEEKPDVDTGFNQSQVVPLTDEEKPDVDTGFTAHDRSLTVPEEVIVYLNQLNAANMIVNARIEEYAKEPIMRFIDGKYAIVDGDKVIMTADWHLIGEFRINGFDEEKMPNDIEFIWGWAVRQGDPHTEEVVKVAEELPYGMQPLTFPLVKFEDIGIVEILKAFAFNTLNLEYMSVKFSEQLSSYGIFGLYNIQWAEVSKIRSPEWDRILKVVREMVNKSVEGGMEKKEAVAEAWKTPEVLSLVADYRRMKDEQYQAKQEFVNKFKTALANPDSISTMDENITPVETPLEESKNEKIDFALKSVEKALNQVEEDELAKLEQIGDDVE